MKRIILAAFTCLFAISVYANDPLTISNAWIRGADMRAGTGPAGFMSIQNHSRQPYSLIGATSPRFGRITVRQREIPILPGRTVELKPGGYQLDMGRPRAPLRDGETVSITLVFGTADRAGKKIVNVPASFTVHELANHMGPMHGPTSMPAPTPNDLVVSDAWIRLDMSAKDGTGPAGFVSIRNTSRLRYYSLIGANSPVFGHITMRRREIPILPGRTVELKPGGYQLDVGRARAVLRDGEKVGVTLIFGTSDRTGKKTVNVPVSFTVHLAAPNDLVISNAWIRMRPGGEDLGRPMAGFITIKNTSRHRSYSLIGVRSPRFWPDLMRQRGITIPPGRTVDLNPYGSHLDLTSRPDPSLRDGERVDLTLIFGTADRIAKETVSLTTSFTVRSR